MSKEGKWLMTAGLAMGIGAVQPQEAAASESPSLGREHAEQAEAIADHVAQLLRQEIHGYSFRVGAREYDNVFKKGPGDLIVTYQYRTTAQPAWMHESLNVPLSLTPQERDAFILRHVQETLAIDDLRHSEVDKFIGAYTVSNTARDMIFRMGGDPTPQADVDDNGPCARIVISRSPDSGTMYLDSPAAWTRIEQITDRATNTPMIEVRIKNEDGDVETHYWNQWGKHVDGYELHQ